MTTKRELRDQIRSRLKRQAVRDRLRHGRRIRASLYRLDVFRKAKCLFIYMSLPEEVDTRPVIRKCLSTGKRVVVPRVNQDQLELREITSARDCEPGAWGVPEPVIRRTNRVNLSEVDCMVLPGLAFDSSGNRLGRGKGFFDRLLSRTKRGVPRIALAYPFQVMDRLPAESHDRPVDVVLS